MDSIMELITYKRFDNKYDNGILGPKFPSILFAMWDKKHIDHDHLVLNFTKLGGVRAPICRFDDVGFGELK